MSELEPGMIELSFDEVQQIRDALWGLLTERPYTDKRIKAEHAAIELRAELWSLVLCRMNATGDHAQGGEW